MLVTLKGYEVEGKTTTSVAHLLNASLNEYDCACVDLNN